MSWQAIALDYWKVGRSSLGIVMRWVKGVVACRDEMIVGLDILR